MGTPMSEARFEVPIGGLNARDNPDNMSPRDALRMLNLVVEGGYLRSRGGTAIQTDDADLQASGNSKRTIATFDAGGTEKLLAGFDDGKFGHSLYDVTSTPVRLSDSWTNSDWNTMMANGRLILTNGQDNPQVWDGGLTTSDATIALFDGGGFPHPTKTKADLWGCVMHQNRAYYWCEDAQSFFYTDTAGAYQGDCTEFDLSLVAKKGGSLINILSQSMDTGAGLQDVAVFVFSTGECLVYEGADPATPTDWGLVNNFNIGQPVSIRATAKWGGDNLIFTSTGVVSIAEVIKYGRVVLGEPTIWNKIVGKANRHYNRSKNRAGWDMHFSPSTGFLIINYKYKSGDFRQLVLNTRTNAWSEFKEIDAFQWTDYNGGLYCSGGAISPHIIQAETGYSDIGNKHILVKCVPAFQDFGHAGWKQLTQVSICTNYRKKIRIDAQVNNHPSADTAIDTPIEYAPGKWNANKWNSITWGTTDPNYAIDTEPNIKRYPCHGRGYTATIKFRAMSRAQQIIWYFYKIKFILGGDR